MEQDEETVRVRVRGRRGWNWVITGKLSPPSQLGSFVSHSVHVARFPVIRADVTGDAAGDGHSRSPAVSPHGRRVRHQHRSGNGWNLLLLPHRLTSLKLFLRLKNLSLIVWKVLKKVLFLRRHLLRCSVSCVNVSTPCCSKHSLKLLMTLPFSMHVLLFPFLCSETSGRVWGPFTCSLPTTAR